MKVLPSNVIRVDFRARRKIPPPTPRAAQEKAAELYAKASALDEAPETADEALALYEAALKANPSHVCAMVNMGNILVRKGFPGKAKARYLDALRLDPKQPEALYNIGYLHMDEGKPAEAIPYFEKAVWEDPKFLDAIFNLACALEEVGEKSKTRPLWRRFLKLEPAGQWADIARDHLGMKIVKEKSQ
jgi:tetratricopeptide (TPR) repeat protein